MSDLIDRQSAIDAIEQNVLDPPVLHDVIATIRELPSAQPEIVRCKDCKYFIEHYYEASLSRMAIIEDWNICEYWERARKTESDDFCSHGERSQSNGDI